MHYAIVFLPENSPVADALGWTLLHALWQGFALVLPAALVLYFLQNRASELRYRLGVSVLLAQLLLSALTFGWYYKPVVSAMASATSATPVPTVAIRWVTVTKTLPWYQQGQLFLEAHLSQFVLVYVIGVALFGLRLVGGWAYLQRLRRTAAVPSSRVVNELLEQLRDLMQIGPMVRVRESARVAMPMVVGVLKPVLLLPVGFVTQLSVRELEAVLAHELAHVKRHDYAVNLLQSVIEVLYFFHPALWWLSARVREEREHCCDDLAVQAIGGNGQILARALARIEELRLSGQTAPALAMAFAGRRQQLLHRVRRVLGVPTRPFVSNASLAGLTLATLLLVSVSVYAVQQQPTPKPKPKPKSTRAYSGVTSGNRIDYGVTDRRLTYVVFNGKRLADGRVQHLQQQLDQVLTGQLNLDTVPQPDRDILLTIFERSAAFDLGMKGLSDGMAQIDYDNIVTAALENAPQFSEETLKELSETDYKAVVNDALASVGNLGVLNDSLDLYLDSLPDKDIHFNQLQAKLASLWARNQALHAQMVAQEKKFEALANQMRGAHEKRALWAARNDLKKQLAFMNAQVAKPEFEPVKSVLSEQILTLQGEAAKLNQQLDSLKEVDMPRNQEMSRHFKTMRRLMDSLRVNEETIIRVNESLVGPPPRAPRPPKPAAVARPIKPARPAAPPAPTKAIPPAPKPK